MIIIGIDPGASGGIAVRYDSLDPSPVDVFKLDATESDIAQRMSHYQDVRSFAYLERVHSMPKQGVSSTFKFAQSYGFLRGLLIALKIPFEEVSPQKWQKAMGCLSKGDKNVTKARAQQLFPQIKVTHASADALLICEYGRRLKSGELEAGDGK